MLSNKLFSSIGNTDRLYVDDVFSAYTYTGNSSTRTITNGIDLAGKGGLVWCKNRVNGNSHLLFDTVRGVNNYLSTAAIGAQINSTDTLTAFNSNGFTLNANATSGNINFGNSSYISWTFRRAPKFFDVVTYTGNGVAGRQIPHALGIAPGMIIVKKISDTGDWHVYHASLGTSQYMLLNSTSRALNFSVITAVSTSNITLPADGSTNGSGATYVAYLFAHDTSTDGIIQCGSYTGTNPSINLGWEPQYVITKCVSFSNAYTGWGIFDASRGFTVGSDTPLLANSTDAESGTYNYNGYDYLAPTATGFTAFDSSTLVGGGDRTYIYLAIRRPNKPPTLGTQVYSHLTRTGSGAVGSTAAVGFAPDLAISQSIPGGRAPTWVDRLRGVKQWLRSDATNQEATQTTSGLSSFDMLGVSYTADNTEQPFVWNNANEASHQRFFKRAPGFFDVVCYTGTGANRTVSHSLGVAPELVIVKSRSGARNWACWAVGFAGDDLILPNSTAAKTQNPPTWNNTTPSASVFSVGTDSGTNNTSERYVAYLFASLPGISKVGSYTGNGSSQTINCGFSTGARFILLKRTDSTGDWYVWDTARGIIAANDPHLSLNTASAEVTTNDSVDPASTGFIVNQVADTNINVNGATYIFLSIA